MFGSRQCCLSVVRLVHDLTDTRPKSSKSRTAKYLSAAADIELLYKYNFLTHTL